jgi:hypothetical protein
MRGNSVLMILGSRAECPWPSIFADGLFAAHGYRPPYLFDPDLTGKEVKLALILVLAASGNNVPVGWDSRVDIF